MFGHAFFGAAYFGPAYFGPAAPSGGVSHTLRYMLYQLTAPVIRRITRGR